MNLQKDKIKSRLGMNDKIHITMYLTTAAPLRIQGYQQESDQINQSLCLHQPQG